MPSGDSFHFRLLLLKLHLKLSSRPGRRGQVKFSFIQLRTKLLIFISQSTLDFLSMKKKILASQKSEISQHEIAGGAIEQMCDEEGNMTPWEENQPQ